MSTRGLNLKNGMLYGDSGYATDSRMKRLNATTLEVGDMAFYDKIAGEYVVVKASAVASVLSGGYDTTRYETNYDTFEGTLDGVARFVARDDSAPDQSIYSNDVAATGNHYRIEIDNTVAGSITFSATSGNGSISSNTVSWDAGDDMDDIVALFTAQNTSYITFAALADSSGVGCELNGYGSNTITVTDSSNCTVIDCSMLAFYRSENSAAPAVGGTFSPTANWTYISSSTHKSWRGSAAASLLTDKNLIAASTTLIANSGYNYSRRCGGNYAKFLSWATSSGDSSWYPDGTDGETTNPGAYVMNESTFNTNVRDFEAEDPDNPTTEESQKLAMQTYYTHLYSDTSGDYAELREDYEAKYGQMTSMYDAYIMHHMIDPAADSGITDDMRGYGKNQTDVKADAMNVTYDYVIIPAYPPEYNASIYGNSATEGFQAGSYYHPEPADIGLIFRDDIMAAINTNIALSGGGTALTSSLYRGSCADYNAYYSWCFRGTSGCVNYNYRNSGYFRSRPVLALAIPS